MDRLDLLDHPTTQITPNQPDRVDQQDYLVHLDHMDHLDQLDDMDHMDHPNYPYHPDHHEHLDHPDQRWMGKLFFSRGGAGRGKAKILRGREPPLPHSAGQGGEGVKIWGAGRGGGGEHTACIS